MRALNQNLLNAENEKNTAVVFRCSDLDLDEIGELIRKGYRSVDEIIRISRLGMGPCQGLTCIPLVLRELSMTINVPIEALFSGSCRPLSKE